MTDRAFLKSNQVFVGIIKKLRRQGRDTTTHKPVVSENDMQKMYKSGTLCNSNPWGLLQKVFFEVSLHFCRRGCEGLRDLKPSSFKFCTDEQGQLYATMAYNETEKKKTGTKKNNMKKQTKCMLNKMKIAL